MTKRLTLAEVLPYVNSQNKNDIISFIQADDRSLIPMVPDEICEEILENDDLRTDVFWYFEIKDDVNIEEYACVHLAYASSERLKKIINKEDGLYILKYDAPQNRGIVIGHCPWCGKKLNTSLQGQN